MLAKKIIKNLETGNYRVEYREYCDCRFYWYLDDGELDCDIQSTDGDCWFDNALVMDDLALDVGNAGIIACYDAYFGLTVTINVSREVEQEIVKAIKDSDAYTQLIADINSPEACNNLHHKRMQASLADWIEDNRYQVYVRYPRGFANEYECMLVVMPEGSRYDTLHVPTDWDAKSPNEWAEMYLANNNIEIITDLYVITLSYYHNDGSIESYGGPDDFYIIESDAYQALDDKTDPDKGDCYELCKYTMDSDGSIDDISHLKTKWKGDIN